MTPDPAKLQEQVAKLLEVAETERSLRQQAEANLAAANAAAATTAAATATAIAAIKPKPKGPQTGDPDKFDGLRGNKAKQYMTQIGLVITADPERYDTDRAKLIFSLSFLKGQASSWAQPWTLKIFTNEEFEYDDFLNAFKCMFFDSEEKARAEASLRALKQTKSVMAYTHQFNTFAHDAGWEARTLISQYRQGLKREVRLALVVSRSTFETVTDISNLALQIDNELNGAADLSSSAPSSTPNPDAMDLSPMRGQLSDAEKSRMMRAGLCFRCSVKGHLSRDCPNKKTDRKGKGKEVLRIAELEEELRILKLGSVSVGASKIIRRNEIDPRLFVPLPFVPITNTRATTQNLKPLTATFLIDSGATHDVIGESYAETSGLMEYATATTRTISGFDGSKSQSSFDINLHLDRDIAPSKFIITKLKDAYDGILGMPWIANHGHRIDWRNRQFKPYDGSIATAKAVSSSEPTNTSKNGTVTGRPARLFDEGVCVVNTLTPPQSQDDTRFHTQQSNDNDGKSGGSFRAFAPPLSGPLWNYSKVLMELPS
ncbi:hypothetical protein PSTG_07573 [Puccinia striiformis f. sp. tritici PST-78]|uniref:CCHC-type domain-containing protein n=1 Tax=Puccinia striiformis f. sp. tritici PST-78 TaxID=1165861 RepID=A0A0L0VIK5_9BASI|nr:hypothetical protein PSTG_07573 [Puccinia striiformis f. sp. tritici PST-78]